MESRIDPYRFLSGAICYDKAILECGHEVHFQHNHAVEKHYRPNQSYCYQHQGLRLVASFELHAISGSIHNQEEETHDNRES